MGCHVSGTKIRWSYDLIYLCYIISIMLHLCWYVYPDIDLDDHSYILTLKQVVLVEINPATGQLTSIMSLILISPICRSVWWYL
jgi:hypothetical protein